MGRLNVFTLLTQCFHFTGIRSHLQTNSLRVRSEAPSQLQQGELLQVCPSATLLILLILITEKLNGKKIVILLPFFFLLEKKIKSEAKLLLLQPQTAKYAVYTTVYALLHAGRHLDSPLMYFGSNEPH